MEGGVSDDEEDVLQAETSKESSLSYSAHTCQINGISDDEGDESASELVHSSVLIDEVSTNSIHKPRDGTPAEVSPESQDEILNQLELIETLSNTMRTRITRRAEKRQRLNKPNPTSVHTQVATLEQIATLVQSTCRKLIMERISETVQRGCAHETMNTEMMQRQIDHARIFERQRVIEDASNRLPSWTRCMQSASLVQTALKTLNPYQSFENSRDVVYKTDLYHIAAQEVATATGRARP